ncbi:hypothetical protein CANARDRAFT_205205 [[Candida] arabinofermentans NRRL YB-2248]|uniref:DUF202 domain-containing protein n=1 Tax=[Candida] arabinofermentans NRRL YB-2248 TaxID=983967 RepID=A0A1E4T7Q9_9ASCO|nr:hypothetical protein CANARDRAFT_205205 [[Candida] arabinofermentans NRRL YB-2248]
MPPSLSILSRVSALLKDEEDLAKITTLQDNINKERASITSQLNLESENRIDKLTSIFESLQNSGKNLKRLKDNLKKVEELKDDSMTNIDRYWLFDKSSVVYSNFGEVENTYYKFLNLPQQFETLNRLLDNTLPSNEDDFDVTENYNDILRIHYELNELRDFKDKLFVMASNTREDLKQIVSKSFSQLDNLVHKFDNFIKLIIDNFVSIVGAQNFGLIIRIIKIIEAEEREDFKLRMVTYLIQDNKKNFKNTDQDKVQESQIKLKNFVQRTQPRDYKQKFTAYFQESIESTFEMILQDQGLDQILNILDENYYEILNAYQVSVPKCFPKNWNFFRRLLEWYQLALRDVILKILNNPDLPNITVVQVLTFDYNNRTALKEKYKLNKAELESLSLLSTEEKQRLLNEHLQFNQSKTKEWVNNATQNAMKLFVLKSKEPPDSTFEKLGIETAQTMIEILRSNINSLLDVGDSPLMIEYLQFFVNDILKKFYIEWTKILKNEVIKWNSEATLSSSPEENNDSTENIGFLPRYVTILANDCVKLINGLEGQFRGIQEMLHVKFHQELEDILSEGSQYIIDTGTECLASLNEFIIAEYQGFLIDIFTKSWYKNGDMIGNSLEVIGSYIIPLKEFLDPELFESLFELVYDTFLLRYLESLNNRNKIDLKKFEECVERDGYLINEQFTSYYSDDTNMNNQIVEDHLYILEILIMIVGFENENDYTQSWNSLLETFNDLPTNFLKLILENKKVKDSKIKFIVDECANNSKNFQLSNPNLTPTFIYSPGKRIALPTRVEPKVFFANERTFLSWLNFTVILGSLAIGLLNFGDKVGRISASLFTLIAMGTMIYALITYHWRASAIRRRGSGPYDDRFGPTMLCFFLLIAVIVNFTLRIKA